MNMKKIKEKTEEELISLEEVTRSELFQLRSEKEDESFLRKASSYQGKKKDYCKNKNIFK